MGKLSFKMHGAVPTIDVYGLPAVISTGAEYPSAYLPADMVKEKWDGKIVIPDFSIKGLYGALRGDIYRLTNFKVTEDFIYDHIDMFVPKKSEIGGFKFCYGMFKGINNMVFDTIDPAKNYFEIEVPDRMFTLESGKAVLRLSYDFPKEQELQQGFQTPPHKENKEAPGR